MMLTSLIVSLAVAAAADPAVTSAANIRVRTVSQTNATLSGLYVQGFRSTGAVDVAAVNVTNGYGLAPDGFVFWANGTALGSTQQLIVEDSDPAGDKYNAELGWRVIASAAAGQAGPSSVEFQLGQKNATVGDQGVYVSDDAGIEYLPAASGGARRRSKRTGTLRGSWELCAFQNPLFGGYLLNWNPSYKQDDGCEVVELVAECVEGTVLAGKGRPDQREVSCIAAA